MITLHRRNPAGDSFGRWCSFRYNTKTPVRVEPGLFSREVIAVGKAAGNLED